MKIRHPVLVKACGLAGAVVLRSWMSSLRFRLVCLGQDVDPYAPAVAARYIYSIWHENLLFPVYFYRRSGMRYLISRHADGQVLAELARHLRVPLVRGSTARGGVAAVRRIMREGGRRHLAVTTDGPRGPRRRVQPGVIYLAANTGMPVVPTGIAYQRPWRLRTWDRMALPRPGTLVTAVAGEPVRVPAFAGRRRLEEYRRLVEARMHEATRLAEAWADTGRRPANFAA